MKLLNKSLAESLSSVLPISATVLLLSISLSPLPSGVLALFLFGTVLLIFGMSLFTIGSDISMRPLGEEIGVKLSRSGKVAPLVLCCFVIGALITIAEPDLTVLAEQIPSVPNMTLILSVAVGVGIFLVISALRTRFRWRLAPILIVFYAAIILLAFFAPQSFVPAAFDSGGVTTGPITVPFIMAFGAGLAVTGAGKKSPESEFGTVALCSIGPILSVLILSICFNPDASTTTTVITDALTTKDAFMQFVNAVPQYSKEVAIAFLPLVGVFVLFQIFCHAFEPRKMARIAMGMLYTYVGLVLFLTGANVGFMPAGRLIGATIAGSGGAAKYWLIPVGALMGGLVVAAEPAVHVLKKQVEEATNGNITQKVIGTALSLGVAASVGISMLRVLTGISILPFLIVGYGISLAISFFVPPVYTGIAFDSGGVASGPMTTTFILPFAVGACEALGGNVLTDAFGIVALVAMTPLITIQTVGLYSRIKHSAMRRRATNEMSRIDDTVVYFDEEVGQ